jgi:hypothetical protein
MLLMSDQLAKSATPVTVMIEVESTKSPEKSIPHASNNKANDTVATITRPAKSPLIALFDFSFDFTMLVSNFGSNLRDIAK